MTPLQFEQRARSCRTRQDLEQLKANALSRGRKDFAHIAHDLLAELFPATTRKGGGATPSKVMFRERVQSFASGKEGYVWLVDQFGLHRKKLFTEYEAFHRKRKSSGCRLAQSPEGLFPVGSTRAEVASNYAAVVGGTSMRISIMLASLRCCFNWATWPKCSTQPTGISRLRAAPKTWRSDRRP